MVLSDILHNKTKFIVLINADLQIATLLNNFTTVVCAEISSSYLNW